MSKSKLTLNDALVYKGSIQPGTSIPTINYKALKTRTHYFAGFLNQLASVNGEVVLSKNDDAVGERSIKGNKLPAGTSFLVTAVRALFDTTANVQTGGVAAASFGKTNAPEVFKNGEIKIVQGADLFVSTGSDVTNFKASTGADDDFRELLVPVELRSDTTFSILIALAGSAAVDQAYKLELRGVEFTDTDKA